MNKYHIDSGRRIKKYEKIIVDGEEVLKETEEWRDLKKRKHTEVLLKRSGIPYHALELTLDDYVGKDIEKIEKMKMYIKDFKDRYRYVHLYFWSLENSTQKTTMASVLGKELLTAGFSVQFTLMSSLIKLLSEERFEPKHEAILNPIRKADFLIIDDSFDRKKATIYKSGYQIPFLDEFLRTRLEIEKKATCFTSNIPIDSIDTEVFGTSLKRLLERSIIDPFHFESSYELRNDFKPEDLWS